MISSVRKHEEPDLEKLTRSLACYVPHAVWEAMGVSKADKPSMVGFHYRYNEETDTADITLYGGHYRCRYCKDSYGLARLLVSVLPDAEGILKLVEGPHVGKTKFLSGSGIKPNGIGFKVDCVIKGFPKDIFAPYNTQVFPEDIYNPYNKLNREAFTHVLKVLVKRIRR